MSSVGGAAMEDRGRNSRTYNNRKKTKCKTIRKTGFAEQKKKDIRTDAWKKTDR